MNISFSDLSLRRKEDRPQLQDEPLLEQLVQHDMFAESLNPINKHDVIEFWRRKGIEVDTVVGK